MIVLKLGSHNLISECNIDSIISTDFFVMHVVMSGGWKVFPKPMFGEACWIKLIAIPLECSVKSKKSNLNICIKKYTASVKHKLSYKRIKYLSAKLRQVSNKIFLGKVLAGREFFGKNIIS
jgi:hypothetical protein